MALTNGIRALVRLEIRRLRDELRSNRDELTPIVENINELQTIKNLIMAKINKTQDILSSLENSLSE